VYPIDEPKGNTLAFANVGIEDLVAINGIRVVNSEKGMFVAMPQSKDKNDVFHDIAFPINSDLRKELNKAVLNAYKEITAEKKQSIGERLSEGAEKAAQYASERAAQPQASYAKRGAGNVGLE
jgi:stage V sporulation protein G